jgi:uncharacterized membrane protein
MPSIYAPNDAVALLQKLLAAARDLTEPSEPNAEYIRGQANLIADACGLGSDRQDSDDVCEALTRAITGAHLNIVGETYYPDF